MTLGHKTNLTDMNVGKIFVEVSKKGGREMREGEPETLSMRFVYVQNCLKNKLSF